MDEGGGDVIAVLVTFPGTIELDRETVRARFEERRANLEGLPGLVSKTFWLDRATGEFGGFYVWESRARAQDFHDATWRDAAAAAYGASPAIRYLEAPIHIANRQSLAVGSRGSA
jgi:heme-degrading monooxygenase HmoA